MPTSSYPSSYASASSSAFNQPEHNHISLSKQAGSQSIVTDQIKPINSIASSSSAEDEEEDEEEEKEGEEEESDIDYKVAITYNVSQFDGQQKLDSSLSSIHTENSLVTKSTNHWRPW